MALQMTQILKDEDANDNNDNDKQMGILRVGSTEHPIVKGFTKIGRSANLCKIVVNDVTVSRIHAEIQAGSDTAFISDVQSANGTRIKDVELKPYSYYTINDGDAIYFGDVRATFATTKSSKRRVSTSSETPLSSKRSNEKNTPGLGNASDCLFNNSSTYQSDDSAIPGTQQNKKFDTPTFQQPPVPAGRPRFTLRTNVTGSTASSSLKSKKQNETPITRESTDATDIHDLETQRLDDPSSFSTSSSSKVPLPQKLDRESIDPNIYDADTQVMSPPKMNVDEPTTKEISKKRTNEATKIFNLRRDTSNDFSRDLLISESPSPPDSPNCGGRNVENIESQDLLEMCETPMRDCPMRNNSVETNNEKREKSKGTKSNVAASKKIVNSEKSISTSHVIAESDDESLTDDDVNVSKVQTSSKNVKSNISIPESSDKIDDDSATDDEGAFESLASRSASRDEKSLRSTNVGTTSVDLNDGENLFEAATQKIVPRRRVDVGSTKKIVGAVVTTEDDTDIDLLPTQILHVPTSTPNPKFRKSGSRSFGKKSFDTEEDLHSAPTQIINDADDNAVSNGKRNCVVGVSSPRAGNTEAKKGDGPAENLDDSLVRNLGIILDQEANNDSLEDDGTPMMTQRLVDILKPTQSFSDKESGMNDDEDGSLLAKRRKTSLGENLGLVGDEAATGDEQRLEVATTVPSATTNDDDGNTEKNKISVERNGQSDLVDDDDDVLAGLPEVRISGTLSNPGSPCSSIASARTEIIPFSPKDAPATDSNVATCSSKIVRSEKSLDSPIVAKKSRITRRRGARKIIDDDDDDQDSDETLGYNDLTKLADNYLASDTVDSRLSRKISNDVIVDDNEKSSLAEKRSSRRVVKKKISTNDANSDRRIPKLSESPSSLIVPGGKMKRVCGNVLAIDDPRSSSSTFAEVSKISSRPVRSKKLPTATSKTVVDGGEESQEVETIMAKTFDEDNGLIARKSYATVHLKRLASGEFSRIINADEDAKTTMGNRKRRATVCAKNVKPEPASPIATKNRRTTGNVTESPKVNKEQHKILITGLDTDDYSKMIKKLGGSVVTDPSKATVLVTDKVRRTFKFLCAVGRGLRIVSINWLKESQKADKFLDCDDFILNDPVAEKKWRFKLAKSLQTARTKKLLEGYVAVVTPKVNQPEIQELKGMVEACGGKVLTRAPGVRAWNDKMVIVSREDDVTAINALLSKCPKSVKVTVQTTEFILSGILRQEVNLVEYKLKIP